MAVAGRLEPQRLRAAAPSSAPEDRLVVLLAERDQAGMDAREIAAARDEPGPVVERAVAAARAEVDREIDQCLSR